MFNKDKALLFLNFAETARLTKNELLQVYPTAVFIEDIKTDTQCYYLRFGDRNESVVIAFRDTEKKIKDWLTDLNSFHTVYPYGNNNSKIQVHKGFIDAYKSVRYQLQTKLLNDIASIKKIYICGHSLGGALATLCAVDVQFNFPIHVECYQSGSPKVGNKEFAKSYDFRVPNTYRTFIKNDIVPTLPPSWIELISKGGYTHIGEKHPIGPFNPFIGLMMLIKRKFKTEQIMDDLSNHSISLYRKYILEAK